MSSEILRIPAASKPPHLAVVDSNSNLTIINLEGKTSNTVKISEDFSRGLVTVDGELYLVTDSRVLKIHRDGKTTPLMELRSDLGFSCQVVVFQRKIYILEREGRNMARIDPVDRSATYDLPRPEGGFLYSCCASDDFMYAMIGFSLYHVWRYSSLTNSWTLIILAAGGPSGLQASAVLNNRLYILNNSASKFYSLRATAEDEGSTMGEELQFFKLPNMNVPRRHFKACIINNQLYAVGGDGGLGGEGDSNQRPIEVFDGRQWKIVAMFDLEEIRCACAWPYTQAESTSRCVRLPGVKVHILMGSLPNDEVASFSLDTVAEHVDDIIDVAPRLTCDSQMEFSKPISVNMETSISAPAGKSIPLILHHRDNKDEEWREAEHLSVGDRNEVDFEIRRGGESRITINFQRWKDMVAAKIRKMGRGISEHFKMKVHAKMGFYIHTQTGQIAVSFCKDQNTYEITKAEFLEGKFTSFSVISHEFIANIDSLVTQTMECKHPRESRITEDVLPAPSFTIDEKFVAKGRQTIYFELDPEPADHWKKIKLLYGYSLNGITEANLPLNVKWPAEDPRNGAETRETRTVVMHSVGQVNVGNIASGDNCVAGSQHVDRSVVASNIYEGEAHVNTTGGSTTVTRN